VNTNRALAFSMSQSKQVNARFPGLKIGPDPWNVGREDADVVAALDPDHLVVFHCVGPNAWPSANPEAAGDRSLFLAAAIDMRQRGAEPNRADAMAEATGPTYPEALAFVMRKGKVDILCHNSGRAFSEFVYDPVRNQIRGRHIPPDRLLPRRYESAPLGPPWHYDFVTGRAVYGSPHQVDKRAFLEWSGKWTVISWPTPEHRVRLQGHDSPELVPSRAFYSRGRLLAMGYPSGEDPHLFEAADDRRSWKDIGAYFFYGQSASQRYWLVEHFPERSFYLADFGKGLE